MSVPMFTGTAGDDLLNGTQYFDFFRLGRGGSDTAYGRGGDDQFNLRGAFDALDAIDGGAGFDLLALRGDYSAGLVFGPATMTGIETLHLGRDFSYNLTLDDANVAAGERLIVDARHVGHSEGSLTFDGSAETDGRFLIRSSIGMDYLTGGDGNDTFVHATHFFCEDTMNGRGGNDTFKMREWLTGRTTIDGGDGFDTIAITGTYLDGALEYVTNVERLVVIEGQYASVETRDATVAAGTTFQVDGSAVVNQIFSFTGYDEADGHFDITGGGNFGEIQGGQLADVISMIPHIDTYLISGFGGGDRIVCNSGEERLDYWDSSDSTGAAGRDRVHGFNADEDKFHFTFDLTGGVAGTAVDATVNKATFDADLAAASSDEVGAYGAWVVHAIGGNQAGHDFLCVDADGDSAYTTGADFVIDITGYTGTLDASDFTQI